MEKISNEEHIKACLEIFDRVEKVLKVKKWQILPMQRKALKNPKSCTLGYINFKTRKIVIDVFTPARAQPKAYPSIMATLAHEVAHIQKPPYRSRYKGHMINRQHYPAFYKQVTRNVKKLKKDKELKEYFR
ncbi:hypothetical protein KKC88_03005 [Patescibacteria group bacterium]|nr:hypothetical protein [Patescibacteria group bacterium]MBU1673466.1 hypothetical protein [Patescibacteria group bacterium]MBU1962912.1 hypothetical protein [Patescibacteria group bacterium]